MTNNKIIYKSGFYLTASLIAALSLVSLNYNNNKEIADVSIRIDYLFHFIAYFFLASFLVFWKKEKKLDRSFFVFLVVFGIFYSTVFEVIQIFVPNRVFNPIDVLFNLAGVIFGIIMVLMVNNKERRREP